WRPLPDLRTSTEAWLTAGAPHHTVLTAALGTQELDDLAEMAGVELLTIGADTTLRQFTKEIRWNQAYYRLAGGLCRARPAGWGRRGWGRGRGGAHERGGTLRRRRRLRHAVRAGGARPRRRRSRGRRRRPRVRPRGHRRDPPGGRPPRPRLGPPGARRLAGRAPGRRPQGAGRRGRPAVPGHRHRHGLHRVHGAADDGRRDAAVGPVPGPAARLAEAVEAPRRPAAGGQDQRPGR